MGEEAGGGREIEINVSFIFSIVNVLHIIEIKGGGVEIELETNVKLVFSTVKCVAHYRNKCQTYFLNSKFVARSGYSPTSVT